MFRGHWRFIPKEDLRVVSASRDSEGVTFYYGRRVNDVVLEMPPDATAAALCVRAFSAEDIRGALCSGDMAGKRVASWWPEGSWTCGRYCGGLEAEGSGASMLRGGGDAEEKRLGVTCPCGRYLQARCAAWDDGTGRSGES